MATDNVVLSRSYAAGEDLTAAQYRLVVLDASTGKVRLPTAATEVALGVLQNSPEAGEAATIMLIGISKIELGATVAIGDWIKLNYISEDPKIGAGIKAASVADLAVGRCLAGGSVGELGEILLSGAVHVVNVVS